MLITVRDRLLNQLLICAVTSPLTQPSLRQTIIFYATFFSALLLLGLWNILLHFSLLTVLVVKNLAIFSNVKRIL